jgi:hypothetical protein
LGAEAAWLAAPRGNFRSRLITREVDQGAVPETTITIDRDGRYELVRNHLGGIEDFWVALERTKISPSRGWTWSSP